MAGPRDDRTKGKPPPGLDADATPLGPRRRSQELQAPTDVVDSLRKDHREGQPVVGQGTELLPRRPGHAAHDCTTCQRAEAMIASRRLRELQALRDGRRVIDLRGDL
jgi:hypothetical protein